MQKKTKIELPKREIKFRIWDKEKKEILRSTFIAVNNLQNVLYYSPLADEWFRFKNPENFILMQYTGLKDKNGKEIYEGDIVKCCRNGKEFIGEIIWGKFAKFLVDLCNLKNDGGIYDFSHFIYDEVRNRIVNLEVIGNIFENKEKENLM